MYREADTRSAVYLGERADSTRKRGRAQLPPLGGSGAVPDRTPAIYITGPGSGSTADPDHWCLVRSITIHKPKHLSHSRRAMFYLDHEEKKIHSYRIVRP